MINLKFTTRMILGGIGAIMFLPPMAIAIYSFAIMFDFWIALGLSLCLFFGLFSVGYLIGDKYRSDAYRMEKHIEVYNQIARRWE